MAVDNIGHPNVKYKPVVLLILDGWGLSPSWGGNAISMNNPPTMNMLWRDYPHLILQAFRKVAGPSGKVGSSEIGHASIGTGRIVEQDLTEISKSITSGQFFDNEVLKNACHYTNDKNGTLHLIGLLSDGAIHSHIDHLFALLKLAKKEKVKRVVIHVITDGRDSEKESAIIYLEQLEKAIENIGIGKIATICGRFYAMDRDENFDRTTKAYEAQVMGKGKYATSAIAAVKDAYKNNFTDENIPPYIITDNNKPVATISTHDAVIFYNFRADRARQLTRFYRDKNYLKQLFWRKYNVQDLYFVTLTDYRLPSLPLYIGFPSAVIESTLAGILADHGFLQLHIAESEKKAHVTYFFNGGNIATYPGERDLIVPSPKVRSYEEKPEMSAGEITDRILEAIINKKYDFVVANFANVDMIGHTGNMEAAAKAISLVDQSIKKIMEAVLKHNACLIITADHGNAEQMIHLSHGDTETMHTLNPVPLIFVTPNDKKNLIKSALVPTKGFLDEIIHTPYTLADIAPTILELFDVAKPQEMTGNSLLDKLE